MAESHRFGHGVAWSYLQSWAARGITSTSFLIVGFMVGPEEFGLYALVVGMLALTEMVCEQALSQTVVQLQISDSHRLSTVFYMGLIFGTTMSVLLFLSAPLIASVFSSPNAVPLLMASAICPALMGLSVVPIGIIRRQLDFKTLAKRTLLASGISSLLGIVLVFLGYGAKGLIAQAITYHLVSVVVLWVNCSWQPLAKASFVEARTVGKLALTNASGKLLDFTETRGVELIIGAVAGVHALGVYAFANKVAQTAFQALVSPVLEVIFAGVARPGDDRAKSLRTGLLILSCVPICGLLFLAFAAHPLLTLLYKDRWQEAATPLLLLSLAYVVRTFSYAYGVALQATGKAQVCLVLDAFRVLSCWVILMLLLLVERHDLVAVAYLCSSVLVFPVLLEVSSKHLQVSRAELLAVPQRTLIACLIGAAPLVVACYFSAPSLYSDTTRLLGAAAAAVVFLALSLKFNAHQLRDSLATAGGGRITFAIQRLMLLLRI
ncbi:MAG: oligosaccharide flippase family protein [Rhizobacter sp.]